MMVCGTEGCCPDIGAPENVLIGTRALGKHVKQISEYHFLLFRLRYEQV